jgi:hypothetical protein
VGNGERLAAITCKSGAIASGSSAAALRGLELSRPNTACAARARSGDEPAYTLEQNLDPLLDIGALEAADLAALRLRNGLKLSLLHCDQCRIAEGELDMPAQQRLQRIGRARRFSDAPPSLGEQPVADVEQHLGEQRLLASEMPVERGAGQADGAAEVADRHAVIPPPGEER